MPIPSVPPRSALSHIFVNETACFDYLVVEGVLNLRKTCECGRIQTYNAKRNDLRCPSSLCRISQSVFAGTFFFKQVLPLNQIMELAYHWLSKSSVNTTIAQTGRSSSTVCAYYKYFRELAADSLNEVDFCIGGKDVVVEIDESKFGKRKYHRGHRVDGVWVLGGVERTPERRVFLVVVPDRSLQTLEDVISRHVYPGSVVHSDLWRGYSQLSKNFDYTHQTVNHSVYFVYPQTRVHTNTIEGTWAGVKLGIPQRNRTKGAIGEHLFEFIWRRFNRADLWGAFISALKDVTIL